MAKFLRINPFWVAAATLVAVSATLQPESIAAEPAATPKAPRIGLALSGGGARGLAHIGVIKVLEELRVPISCITGTSMGSVVGGSYASGTPVSQLEEMALKTDWDEVFRDNPPRADVASERKLDDYKTLFAPQFGIKNGSIALPKGIIAGVSIQSFLRALTERSAGITDFRKLPIPFSAVAADIVTGDAVVLDHGSVAGAMRASMSVPGAIAPFEIDGRLLVDGGIANNLPIDEARKLCADVVIAVNISTPPLKRAEIKSAFTVLAQLINFLGKTTVDQQLKNLNERDVLIAPDLGDISSVSFDRATEAIRIGEETTRKLADSLRRYSLPPEQYAALRAKQTVPEKPLGTVDAIRFEGLHRTNPEVLRALVHSKPGEPLTEKEVNADLLRIYGRGDFESVDYRIEQGPAGRVMIIHPREKEWGPDYLRFGLGLATDFQGENIFNVLVQYRKTWLNRLGGEWLNEAQIGQNAFLQTQLIQPVEESGRFFVAPYARISQTYRGVFVGENRVADYQTREARIGLDGGVILDTWGEARLGAMWRHVNAEVDTGPAVLPSVDQDSAGPRALLYVDQLDHAWFPRAGYRALGSAYVASSSFGSDENYKRLEGQILGAKSWGRHTFNVSIAGGTDLNSDMPAYENFTLGGPLRLSGYRIDEFSGRRFGFGRVMYYNRVLPLPEIFGSGVYLGGSLEVGEMSGRINDQSSTGTIWSGSVFLGADTFAGPAYAGFGVGQDGSYSFYLLLGAP